jgi:hypothetical protein
LENFFQNGRGSCRVDDNSSPFAECLGPLHGAMQIHVSLKVGEKRIRACRHKFFEEKSVTCLVAAISAVCSELSVHDQANIFFWNEPRWSKGKM